MFAEGKKRVYFENKYSLPFKISIFLVARLPTNGFLHRQLGSELKGADTSGQNRLLSSSVLL